MGRWHGDEWRWRPQEHPSQASSTISVIEVPDEEKKDPPPRAKRVPFGFSRALAETDDWEQAMDQIKTATEMTDEQRRLLAEALGCGDVPLC